jgi:hypothetical protein
MEDQLTLTVTVKYETNGVPIEELKRNLQGMVDRAIGEGLLTHYTEAEVVAWRAEVK